MQRPSRIPIEALAQTVALDTEPERLVIRPKQVRMPEDGLVVFESRHGPGFFGELTDS